MPTRSPSPAVALARARLAGLHHGRARDPDDPELVEARRELELAKLVEQVKKVAAGLPPLTEQQVDSVARLLRAGSRSRKNPGG